MIITQMACIGSKCSKLCGELACIAWRYVSTVNIFTIHPHCWKPWCVCPTASPLLHLINWWSRNKRKIQHYSYRKIHMSGEMVLVHLDVQSIPEQSRKEGVFQYDKPITVTSHSYQLYIYYCVCHSMHKVKLFLEKKLKIGLFLCVLQHFFNIMKLQFTWLLPSKYCWYIYLFLTFMSYKLTGSRRLQGFTSI